MSQNDRKKRKEKKMPTESLQRNYIYKRNRARAQYKELLVVAFGIEDANLKIIVNAFYYKSMLLHITKRLINTINHIYLNTF